MAGRAYFFLRASRGCLAEPKVLSLLRADGRRGPKNSLHFAWPAAQPAVCPLARQPAGHSKIFSELRAASRLTGQPATPGPASRTCFICFSWFLSWLFFYVPEPVMPVCRGDRFRRGFNPQRAICRHKNGGVVTPLLKKIFSSLFLGTRLWILVPLLMYVCMCRHLFASFRVHY